MAVYKLCKTEQSAQRQRQLEDGLLQVMSTVHYDEISVSDLCDRMNVPRKSFYRYFSGKDGALQALIDHTLMRYEGRSSLFAGKSQLSVQKELEVFFEFWIEQKPLLDALARSGLSGVLIQRAIDYALGEAGYRRNQPMAALGELEYGIMFAISGLMTMTVQWHHCGYDVTVSQMATFAERVLTKPLFDRK